MHSRSLASLDGYAKKQDDLLMSGSYLGFLSQVCFKVYMNSKNRIVKFSTAIFY